VTKPDSWLAAPPRPDAAARLFCFAYAGGSASVYSRWPRAVASWIDVIPVELPGRGARFHEPPRRSLLELADDITTAIEPWLDRPYAIFGHSMGALLGFETTRALRRRNAMLPRHLFFGACRAPHLPRRRPLLSRLDPAAFLEAIRNLDGTPQEVLDNPELRELFLPVLRADFAACEDYRHPMEAPLPVPISAFGGDRDVDVEREALWEWKQHTTAGFAVHEVAGNHFFLRTHAAAILTSITEALTSARGTIEGARSSG
jgi:surfactin synthase thioesterase subunit